GPGRARAVRCVRGRVEDPAPAVKEVTARRLSRAVRHALEAAAVHVHDVLLIAGAAVAGGLEDQAPAVGAEVGLGVLAAVRELADVGEAGLAFGGRDGPDTGSGIVRRGAGAARNEDRRREHRDGGGWM